MTSERGNAMATKFVHALCHASKAELGVCDRLLEVSHLGGASSKIPDSLEFQSWKVNFSTEVGSKTVDPHLTMQWIKEVQTAKSIDDLMRSRSIVGRTPCTMGPSTIINK